MKIQATVVYKPVFVPEAKRKEIQALVANSFVVKGRRVEPSEVAVFFRVNDWKTDLMPEGLVCILNLLVEGSSADPVTPRANIRKELCDLFDGQLKVSNLAVSVSEVLWY